MKKYTISKKQRLEAIDPPKGKITYLSAALQNNEQNTKGNFEHLPPPKPGEWLYTISEELCSFKKYKKQTPLPRKHRTTLYIQPLGNFGSAAPNIEIIREYAEIFFQMKTKILPTMEITTSKKKNKMIVGHGNLVTFRGTDDELQLKVGDLLDILEDKPEDAHCVMGLTMIDLYPDENYNFVFGCATASTRVGVFSFARYDPYFFEEKSEEVEYTQEENILILRRALNVMVHETGHMMGLPHCVYFKCMMNGAMSLEESDSQPSYECPACLRKFHYHLNFDVEKRFNDLLQFYKKYSLKQEAEWLKNRMATIAKILS